MPFRDLECITFPEDLIREMEERAWATPPAKPTTEDDQ